MNALFAVATYTGLFATVGADRIATTQVDTVYASELPDGARALATLSRGDRIVAVNGDSVSSWGDLLERLVTSPLPLTIRVAGRPAPPRLDLPAPHPEAPPAVTRGLEGDLPGPVRTGRAASPPA